MSMSLEQEVRCPCGEEFESKLWSAVNGQADLALREEILAGQLNVVRCPHCGQMIYAERFVLYHEPGQELMAFVYPKDYASEAETWRNKTTRDFQSAQNALEPGERLGYEPFPLFGLDELVTVLQDEQEAADQSAILESLAPSANIDVHAVRPSLARSLGLPRRLPLHKDGTRPLPDRLQEGLSLLLDINGELTLYAALREKLRARRGEVAAALETVAGAERRS